MLATLWIVSFVLHGEERRVDVHSDCLLDSFFLDWEKEFEIDLAQLPFGRPLNAFSSKVSEHSVYFLSALFRVDPCVLEGWLSVQFHTHDHSSTIIAEILADLAGPALRSPNSFFE